MKSENDQKKISANKDLIAAHPFIVPMWGKHPEKFDCPEYNGSYTIKDLAPKGWGSLIVDMCDEIETYALKAGIDINDIGVYDIGEKNGMLQVFADGKGFDEQCQDIIDSYCEKSLLVCPFCGKPTKYITTDANSPVYLCPECADMLVNESKETVRPLTEQDTPYYTYHIYDEKTQEEKGTRIQFTHHDAQFRSQWGKTKEAAPRNP